MLLLIATYGIRRSEVSSLDIDDILWRARIPCAPRPKVGTPLVMPLTDEVATALVEYLRQRAGETSERRLFLRVRAPRGPIQPTAVFDVFDYWAGAPVCEPRVLAVRTFFAMDWPCIFFGRARH